MTKVLGIIPARLASTRLPRKVLLDRTGKPLIQHVWEGATACRAIGKVVVATDAEEVAVAVKRFGGEAVLTSPACASGTDRVAEAARHYPGFDIVVNIQGDEPEMSPEPLTALVQGMLAKPAAIMGTIAVPWPKGVPLAEPGFVKLVTDAEGFALYFSRSPIPFYRDEPGAAPGGKRADGQPRYLKHVGLYAFRAPFLQMYAAMKPTPLEQAEALEQLRALENGHRIAVFLSSYHGYEVNTPADYEAFVARCKARLVK
ncbi:MAG: 3-deoxy-manno-octulosonate cytidylyltransferase [Planctomycetes bacterium]|nr:3-deoxy-manno-octulosonate cytidylyltransferase [Planctomycetota bacterium]